MLKAKAMVLAAGFGTRLRPLTNCLAKPAVPVCNRPAIHYVLSKLAAAGVRDVIINTHHLPETVRQAVADQPFGLHIVTRHEPEILGTGGGLLNAGDFFSDEPFLLLNGDTIAEADLAAAFAAHQKSGALATLILLDDPRMERYGAVEVDEHGTIVDFSGMPERRGKQRGLFIGAHVLDPRIFSRMPREKAFCIIREVYLPLLRAEPGSIKAVFGGGRFFDLGAPADYLAANFSLLDQPGDYHFYRQGLNEIAPGVWVDPQAKIDSTAKFQAPVLIGAQAFIGQGASIGPYVIVGARATVEARSRLSQCVLWPEATARGKQSMTIFIPGEAVYAE